MLSIRFTSSFCAVVAFARPDPDAAPPELPLDRPALSPAARDAELLPAPAPLHKIESDFQPRGQRDTCEGDAHMGLGSF